ncbi:MAG: BBP7 family outer membrane beta-barrel protein [Lacipirellulaceae bacterium]
MSDFDDWRDYRIFAESDGYSYTDGMRRSMKPLKPPAYFAPRGDLFEGNSSVKYNIALAIITLLGVSVGQAVAQVPAGSGAKPVGEGLPAEAVPPGMELPEGDLGASSPLTPDLMPPEIPDPAMDSSPFAARSGGEDDAIDPFIPGENVREFQCDPALLESSGTWLERGFWYAQADTVILNRTWERKGVLLMSEQGTGISGGGLFQFQVGNYLNIDGDKPGADATFRLTLGRFLFRDGENRDHTTEFSWWGDGHWNQEAQLRAATANGVSTAVGLQVSDFIDRVNSSFDGASFSRFVYESHLDSFEWNYHVKQRMARDRMELQPSGQWVRKANSTLTYSYLAGLRYINLREALDWQASGIPNAGGPTLDGRYFVTTDNNLLGTQLGGSVATERDRWSIEIMGKAGGYWNAMDTNTDFNIGTTNGNQANGEEDTLSFVGEARVTGRWHLKPNLSIRAGLELLYVNTIALAPFQVNFIQDANLPIVESGDAVYLGTSLGIEGYW